MTVDGARPRVLVTAAASRLGGLVVAALAGDAELQYGFKFRQRKKRNDFNFCGYDPLSDVLLSDTDLHAIEPYFNTVHGPAPSYHNGRSYIALLGAGNHSLSDGTTCRNPGDFFEMSGDEDEESIAADWYTDEDVLAAYAMATTMTDTAMTSRRMVCCPTVPRAPAAAHSASATPRRAVLPVWR